MKKPHELDAPVKRRAALGLLGGFVVTLATAPAWHARTVLDVEVDVDRMDYARVDRRGLDPQSGVVGLGLELANHDDVAVEPMFTTWDHRRKTRHRWAVERGPDILDVDERADYLIEAPTDEAAVLPGYRMQLTVWQLGEGRWKSIHLTPEERVPPL